MSAQPGAIPPMRPIPVHSSAFASSSTAQTSVWDRISTWASENKAVVYTIAGVAVVVTGAGVAYYLTDSVSSILGSNCIHLVGNTDFIRTEPHQVLAGQRSLARRSEERERRPRLRQRIQKAKRPRRRQSRKHRLLSLQTSCQRSTNPQSILYPTRTAETTLQS